MHVEGDYALVHAGSLAPWTVRQARELAHEVEGALQGPHWVEFLDPALGREADPLER